ncbi:trypsin-like serine peptidase [Plantactinospora sp. CA-290183]|uniref:trypsin-like serine peptidase n=1 Tax=Plantactinospora sp. CA-290183 TaxID=3240006 RepID=UPI003D90C21F
MRLSEIRRRVVLIGSATFVTGALLAVTAGSVQAASTGGSRAEAASSSAAATVSASARSGARAGASTADQAASYWTPERMRSAISADTLVNGVKSSAPTRAKPTGPAYSVPPAAPVKPAVAGLAGAASAGNATDRAGVAVNASASVGKVFFHNPANGGNYVCSAGTVNSGSRLLVMTAGHCVHGGQGGQWMQNWVFVPLYNYGAEPYGRWSAKWLTTFNAWINDSNLERDVAYVTVWPNASGQRPVDVLGGNGLSVNYSFQQFVTILAYPQAPPFDGGWQQYCQGTTSRPGTWPFQEYKIQLRCGFTGGSSGAVWLRAYNGNLGYVNGVMSTLNSSGWNKSPYFDTAVADVYNSVANRV